LCDLLYQALLFNRIDVGREHEPGQDIWLVARLLNPLADGAGVVAQPIHAAAVGEAVDEGQAVVSEHDLGLAATVVDAFYGICHGQPHERRGVVEYLTDAYDVVLIVQRQNEVGREDSADALFDRRPRLIKGHALPMAAELLSLFNFICITCSLALGIEALIFCSTQRSLGRDLARSQRRAGGARVKPRSGVDLRSPSRRVLDEG